MCGMRFSFVATVLALYIATVVALSIQLQLLVLSTAGVRASVSILTQDVRS